MERNPGNTRQTFSSSLSRPFHDPTILFTMLLVFWGMINFAQAVSTEISYDEAYYWMYAKHLAWGYFDQPPMIALFISMGNWLFHQELGARMTTILAQLLTLCLVWKLVRTEHPTTKQVWLFFGIAAAVPMFQVFGFLATPDSPLLLFTALFLVSYHQFLDHQKMIHVALLGVSMAGMLYSKYHGGLFIALILLSNLRLLRNPLFWAAGIGALLFFLPHLWWQYQNDFPSFTYHLVARNKPFELKNLLNYWPNQFLSFNPFFLGLVLYLMIRFRPADIFERGIYLTITGFLLFFFASAYRGHVEPHWTTVTCLGMITLTFRHTIENDGVRKYVLRFLFPSLALLVLLRLALVFPILPVNTKFQGEKAWCEKLLTLAGDHPVVIRNSYQKSSIYAFNTGREAISLNSFGYRKNQYDLWHMDDSLYNKPVVGVSLSRVQGFTPVLFPNGKEVYIQNIPHFFTAEKLKIHFLSETPGEAYAGDTLNVRGELFNPYPYPVPFQDSILPVSWYVQFFGGDHENVLSPLSVSPSWSIIHSHESIAFSARFKVPELVTGKYAIGILQQEGGIQASMISPMIELEIR